MSTDFSAISTTGAPVTAPSWPAYAATASAFLAVAAVLPGNHNLSFAAVGYVLGALIVPAFTVIYRFMNRAAKKNPFFIPNLTVERLVLAMLAVGILAGVVNAWFVATELAKQ